MKPLHGALLLTGLAIAIWVAGYLSQPEVEVMSGEPGIAATQVQSSVQGLSEAPATLEESDLLALKTFRGAQVDGALRTGLHGELVVDMALRRWIDFYLSARGEVELNELVAAMHAEMAQLPQPGQNQAIDLLEDYLGYLAALGNYDEEAQRRLSGADFDAMAGRLEWQKRLRREWLEPNVVAAFFGEDEAMDDYTLERIRLVKQGASAEELATLEQTLPDELQQLRARSRLITNMHQQESDLRANGASAADVQAWRVQQFGAEAAGRLAEVDQRREQWQSRLRDYQQYSQSLALKGLSENDRNQLLESYQQRHFSEDEIKRLPAALSLLAAE